MAIATINVHVALVPATEYVEEHHGASFRRTNIEGIVLCDVCYSLVSYEHTYYHSDWHDEIKEDK